MSRHEMSYICPFGTLCSIAQRSSFTKIILLSTSVQVVRDTGHKKCFGGGIDGKRVGGCGCQPVQQILSLSENICP